MIVPSGDGTVYIPLQTHLEYLGVKLSYCRYEVQAAQHRVQQAQTAFSQLQAPLRTNGPLSQKHRLRLYKACVLPPMFYGLVSVGCTLEVVKLLSSNVARHMRKVLRIHEKGYSNQQVLQQAGIHVVSDIECRVLSQSASLALDTCRSPQLQVRECKRAEHLQQQFYRVKEISEQRIDSMLLKNIPGGVELPCPVCGVY